MAASPLEVIPQSSDDEHVRCGTSSDPDFEGPGPQVAELEEAGHALHGDADVEEDEEEHGIEYNEDTEEEEEDEEDATDDDLQRWSVVDATAYLYAQKVKHCISDNAFKALWIAFKKVMPILAAVSQDYLPSAETIKRQAMKFLPEMVVDVAHKNLDTGEDFLESGLARFPKKRYENKEHWEHLYEIWRVDLTALLRYHERLHRVKDNVVIINIDGVPIGRTGRSQTIVSLKFQTCRNVYQVVNAIPSTNGKKMLTVPLLLGQLCHDLKRLQLNIKYISADAPMRAFLRKQKSHSGRKACDYCYGTAGHEGKPIWSVRTLNAEPRSYAKVLRDYEEHDRTGRPLQEFGYNAKCELVELLPGFDIVDNIPVDSMHLLYLGVARCLFELLFKVGERRDTNRPMERVCTSGLNKSLPIIRVPNEIGRRPRPIDYKNYKASEWRNLILYYFPLTLNELPKGLRCQFMLEFCYLARAYSLDEESWARLNHDDLERLALKWYRNYNAEFGKNNMRYNIHLLAHLLRMRIHGPFSETSAFDFESSFAASSRAQKPGTTSVGLQSMRHSYIRPREGHTCSKTLILRDKITARSNDTLVYTRDGLYEIVQALESTLVVKRINVGTYFPPIKTHLEMSSIGVWKYLFTDEDHETILRTEVQGKLLAIPTEESTVMISATKSMLMEGD